MALRTLVANFQSDLGRINETGAPLTSDADRQAIKRNIGALYEFSASRSLKGDLWNWGMHRAEVERTIDEHIPQFNRYDTDGFSEQLYCYALLQLPIRFDAYGDRRILEVGCGLGEGLNFLSRIVNARRFVGVDLCDHAIARARARASRPQVEFLHGDAEQLPLEDGTFDVVVNIESSHTYPDLMRFFDEVSRVLKPGGFFSHIDLFTAERYALMTQLKQATPDLVWTSDEDLSDDVKAAIRRRMAPDSLFRTTFREKRARGVGDRLIGERMLMSSYGGVFVGHQHSAFSNFLKRVLMPDARTLPVVAYRHHIARKRHPKEIS